MKSFAPTRRTFLKTGTAASALIGLAPALLRQAAAQDADLAPYKSAKIDWKQTSGETITVAVIPASYFENLIYAGAAVQGTDRHRRPRSKKSRRRRSARRA